MDMEHFLGVYIDRQNETGVSVINSCLKSHAKSIHIKLKDSRIYKANGSRCANLKDMSASVIESQLEGGDTEGDHLCAICDRVFSTAKVLIQPLTDRCPCT